MTDRELLEAAAKAAGIELDWAVPPKSPPWRVTGSGEDRGPAAQWNPLTYDGDALRLAVKLCIDIKPPRTEDDDAQARQIEQSFGMFETQRDTDPYAATRRAITRAAAELGRHLENVQ